MSRGQILKCRAVLSPLTPSFVKTDSCLRQVTRLLATQEPGRPGGNEMSARISCSCSASFPIRDPAPCSRPCTRSDLSAGAAVSSTVDGT